VKIGGDTVILIIPALLQTIHKCPGAVLAHFAPRSLLDSLLQELFTNHVKRWPEDIPRTILHSDYDSPPGPSDVFAVLNYTSTYKEQIRLSPKIMLHQNNTLFAVLCFLTIFVFCNMTMGSWSIWQMKP